MLPRCRMVAVLLVAVTLAGSARAEPFRDDRFHFSVKIPDDWAMMHPNRVREINHEFNKKPGGDDVVFYGGFCRKVDGGATFPYVLVQFIPMERVRNHQEVANWLSMTNNNQKVELRDEPVRSIAGLQVDQMLVDVPSNRAISVREHDDTIRKPKPGKPNEFEEEKARVRTITVGFLGAQYMLLFHYWDRAEGFDTRVAAFDQLINSYRFDEGFAFRPVLKRVGPSEDKDSSAPTADEQRWDNLKLGVLLALGLGVLCALFVWRAKSATYRR